MRTADSASPPHSISVRAICRSGIGRHPPVAAFRRRQREQALAREGGDATSRGDGPVERLGDMVRRANPRSMHAIGSVGSGRTAMRQRERAVALAERGGVGPALVTTAAGPRPHVPCPRSRGRRPLFGKRPDRRPPATRATAQLACSRSAERVYAAQAPRAGRTRSRSGRPLMPLAGGAIQLAILPRS